MSILNYLALSLSIVNFVNAVNNCQFRQYVNNCQFRNFNTNNFVNFVILSISSSSLISSILMMFKNLYPWELSSNFSDPGNEGTEALLTFDEEMFAWLLSWASLCCRRRFLLHNSWQSWWVGSWGTGILKEISKHSEHSQKRAKIQIWRKISIERNEKMPSCFLALFCLKSRENSIFFNVFSWTD